MKYIDHPSVRLLPPNQRTQCEAKSASAFQRRCANQSLHAFVDTEMKVCFTHAKSIIEFQDRAKLDSRAIRKGG